MYSAWTMFDLKKKWLKPGLFMQAWYNTERPATDFLGVNCGRVPQTDNKYTKHSM